MIDLKFSVSSRGQLIVSGTQSIPGLSQEEWKAAFAAAWQEIGQWWWTERLPRHFTQEGAAEYAYERRTGGYLKRKERPHYVKAIGMAPGTTDPLVFSGETRRAALRTMDVKADEHGCIVTLRGLPRHIWMSQYGTVLRSAVAMTLRKGGKGKYKLSKAQGKLYRLPNMVRELTTISREEARMISEMIEARLANQFAEAGSALAAQEELMSFAT